MRTYICVYVYLKSINNRYNFHTTHVGYKVDANWTAHFRTTCAFSIWSPVFKFRWFVTAVISRHSQQLNDIRKRQYFTMQNEYFGVDEAKRSWQRGCPITWTRPTHVSKVKLLIQQPPFAQRLCNIFAKIFKCKLIQRTHTCIPDQNLTTKRWKHHGIWACFILSTHANQQINTLNFNTKSFI